MGTSTIIYLALIGLLAGTLSGMTGVGGGIIVVPSLVLLLGLSQHEAQGMSLLMMLPPIGIFAAINYYKELSFDKTFMIQAGVMACLFILGGYLGSKLALKISPDAVKLVFGVLMLVVSIKMILSGSKIFSE